MSRLVSSFHQCALLGAVDGIQDGRRGLGPPQRFRDLGVVDPDVALDLFTQFFDAAEHAAIQGSALQLPEPAFHRVEPGGTGRGEMKMEARMSLDPLADLGGLVRAAVVEE